MNIHHMGLHLCNFLMWLIIESQSQSTTFCGTRKPVIKICTSDALTDQTSVNIDSSSIPLFCTISCKCTITPSNLDVEFIFTLKDTFTSKNTLLKINEILFDANTKEEDKTRTTRLSGETDLIFNTSGMARTALCVIVASENEVRFDITCLKQTFITATTERPLSSASTVVYTSALPSASTAEDTTTLFSALADEDVIATEAQVVPEDTNEQNKIFLVILPTVIGAVLLLTAMISLFIFKMRYRLAKATGNKNATSSPVESPPELTTSTQGQNDESNSESPTHPYERLNVYVNDTFDEDMYQQLDTSREDSMQPDKTPSKQPYQSRTTSYTNVLSQGKEYYNI